MSRRLRVAFVFSSIIVVALGCNRTPPADPIHGNLELKLPKTTEPPDYDRKRNVGKLTVNGKDYSEPRGLERKLDIKTDPGKDEVRIEYSYWPTQYENVIRTRVVKLIEGQTVKVDMTSSDPEMPDAIIPIFVPTPRQVVTEMGRLAKIGPSDVVYDIGCGEGVMLLQAVKEFNAKKGVGIEIDDKNYAQCLVHRKAQGLDDRVQFRHGDALKIDDFSEATVVLLYVGDELGKALQPTLQRTLKPGARIVSHRFLLGAWLPDQTKTINARDNDDWPKEYRLHLWHVRE